MTHRREKERKTGDMMKGSETEGKRERKEGRNEERERDRSRRVIVRQKALP